jgi:hypothetical protein
MSENKEYIMKKKDEVEKFQVELGEETIVQTHEFKDTKMDGKTALFLKNYAMEHILSDNDTLINYAFNRILAEQVKKEQEKNIMIRRLLEGEVTLLEDDEVTVRKFKVLLAGLLEKESSNNPVKESMDLLASVMKKSKRPKKIKTELF